MKCPKCGYLGFESVARCRNCGYDFSLTPADNLPDLTLRDADAREDDPAVDHALLDAAALGQHTDSNGSAATSDTPSSSRELLLFADSVVDDEPLITRPSPPRQPLSVRRATPELPRLRSQTRTPMLDLAPDSDGAQPPARSARSAVGPAERSTELEPAGLFARAAAVAIDLLILAAIDLVVIYFTMKICGLTVEDFAVLPKGPLITFLLVQNGGYLVAFTVGGQTLGKMAAGIKVIPAAAEPPIDLGRSVVRTLVWLALAVPAGLGFLTALIGSEHRGLHDRCAGTRVVRASA